tara:strand:+ start:261 stop:845 length:585 start_codon:yes stop_codon:yes gene_type:complete
MSSLNIFTKCPFSGNPKQRLKDVLTLNERSFATQYMLENILNEASKIDRVNINLWVYPKFENNYFLKLKLKYKINLKKQIGKSLEERMINCVKEQIKSNKKIIIIGSDIPALTTNILNEAVTQLDNFDYTIGPSTDGGFYLLGLKKFVIKKLSFSKHPDKSLSILLNTINKNKLTYKLLKKLKDIDTKEDLLFI